MVEFIEIKMRIEKVHGGSSMRYELINQSDNPSEKFKEILSEDYDIEVEEYTSFVDSINDEIYEN